MVGCAYMNAHQEDIGPHAHNTLTFIGFIVNNLNIYYLFMGGFIKLFCGTKNIS